MQVVTEADLRPGEVICNKCDGGGSFPQKFREPEDPVYNRCPKCWGDGVLDWIHNITGKPSPFLFKFPKVRQQYPSLLAKELISVQPMDKPDTVKAFIKAQYNES